jgi:protein involved in polysaccharide export with SLBB domain/glycosyltransferase involved in cell wall biosynthesis
MKNARSTAQDHRSTPHIAILGIRGVPAAHGGFETFAERLALYLVANGWRVTVYCQEEGDDPVFEDQWEGVHRVHIPSGADNAVGTIRFDWRCIAHAVKHKPDVALTLGYNTAVFCARLRLAGVPNAINMDGIEWMRDKWGRAERAWLYLNDWAACWLGNRLIADHPSIARHLRSRAPQSKITMIPYGADFVDQISDAPVRAMGLEPGRYLTLIARPEIENSVLEIVRAFSRKRRGVKLVVLGRYAPDTSAYHRAVLDAASDEVVFAGAIYEANTVRALRRHCLMYVHGHRVGGTNPSLVEALAAGNAVLAHQNRFNYWVAGPQAEYFADEKACAEAFEVLGDVQRLQEMAHGSRMRHWEAFRWEQVLRRYEILLLRLARGEAEPTRAQPPRQVPVAPQPSQNLPTMSFSGSAWLDVDSQRRLLRALLGLMVVAWLVVGLMGCSSPPVGPAVSVVGAALNDAALRRGSELPAAPPPGYRLAPGDELDIRFPDYGQYDQSVKVRPDGKITLQVIGTVHAQGRTPEDVQQEVQERYRAQAGGAGERSYLIRPTDEIEIKFAYQPQLNELVKVRPDGKIALQLAGTVLAQGKSPEELQAELVQRYGKVLRAPELSVIMRSFSSQALRVGQGGTGRAGVEYLQPVLVVKQSAPEQVFVGGEVQRPGVLALKPGMTLLQAVLEAGGQLPSAELRAVTVLRKGQDAQPLVIRRDLSRDVAGLDTQDIVLEPSDVVLLPQTAVATLAQNLDQYLFKTVPFVRNSSFGFSYVLRGQRY